MAAYFRARLLSQQLWGGAFVFSILAPHQLQSAARFLFVT